MRLVGDIGGTNARFALADEVTGELSDERTLPGADYPDLATAAAAYLGDRKVRAAAVAVAAVVSGDVVELTNGAWRFSVQDTRDRLGLERLHIVNDFTALALALPRLTKDERRQVGGGTATPNRPIALLGAGTGLGVSGLIPSPSGWVPLEGEGGHTAFAPTNAREAAVLERLRSRFEHVSTERVASGPGLTLLYETLAEIDGLEVPTPAPGEIVRRAQAGDARCDEVIEMFCGVLGTAAADLCLTLGALGGVYVGGGVVPRLGPRFDRSCFRERFEAKGRFRTYVAQVPTYVITAANPALRGAACFLEGPAV